MIDETVNKLIENLPDEVKNVKSPKRIDVILDGGIFNGSYLIGALHFLKEMERRKYIKVERISGCSVGAICALLYYIDGLDLVPYLYEIINSDFRQTYNLKIIQELKEHIKQFMNADICEKVNKKLYITYHNIRKHKKCIKYKYKDIDDILDTIIRSSYIPYLINNEFLYKNKYIDGMTPYIFTQKKGKKIIYMDLYGYDKIFNLLNIKNENTNYHRILSGVLDIHSFYIKNRSTAMCSYVNNWQITNIGFNYMKQFVERIILYGLYFVVYVKERFASDSYVKYVIVLMSSMVASAYILFIKKYCI